MGVCDALRVEFGSVRVCMLENAFRSDTAYGLPREREEQAGTWSRGPVETLAQADKNALF